MPADRSPLEISRNYESALKAVRADVLLTCTTDAMNRLHHIALNGRDNDAVRASEAILDRPFGRTKLELENTGAFGLNIIVAPLEPNENNGRPPER